LNQISSLTFALIIALHHRIAFSQIRLLFNRKNKTLRSVLMTKATLKLLEENRKTLQSLSGDQGMDTGDESVADILERILGQPQYKDKRARNLGLDDFLHLLADFHQAGIHFAA